jgi:hypothetical protein
MINDLGPDLVVPRRAQNRYEIAHKLPTNLREADWRDAPRR